MFFVLLFIQSFGRLVVRLRGRSRAPGLAPPPTTISLGRPHPQFCQQLTRERRFGFGALGPALGRGQLGVNSVQVVGRFPLRLLGCTLRVQLACDQDTPLRSAAHKALSWPEALRC
ncbi:hypothetical protein [Cupriavidus necator]|uniref:hypothetical protein n=1 Tax=Cupriavidus necator TaxID=106590 RepID=UPI0005B4A17D|nr:hypothetical protein [Cupriavidus necator]